MEHARTCTCHAAQLQGKACRESDSAFTAFCFCALQATALCESAVTIQGVQPNESRCRGTDGVLQVSFCPPLSVHDA